MSVHRVFMMGETRLCYRNFLCFKTQQVFVMNPKRFRGAYTSGPVTVLFERLFDRTEVRPSCLRMRDALFEIFL